MLSMGAKREEIDSELRFPVRKVPLKEAKQMKQGTYEEFSERGTNVRVVSKRPFGPTWVEIL